MVGCGSSCEEGTADLMGSLVGGPMPTPTPGSRPGHLMMMGELSLQTRHVGDFVTVWRTRTKKQLQEHHCASKAKSIRSLDLGAQKGIEQYWHGR